LAGYDRSQLTNVSTTLTESADLTSATLGVTGTMPVTQPVGTHFDYVGRFVVWGDGKIDVQTSWSFSGQASAMTPLPRVGLIFRVPNTVEQMTWYGRGPHENYPDRLTSAPLGIYSSTVTGDLHTGYIKPQENGGRGGIRWASLEGPQSTGLRATATAGASDLHMSLSRYSMSNLLTARHTADLVPSDALYWHIDAAQAGLGGDSSWEPRTHPEFRLTATSYSLSFVLSLLSS